MAISNTTRAFYGNNSVNLLVTSDSTETYTLGSDVLLAGATVAEKASHRIYSEFLNVVFFTEDAALTRFAELGGVVIATCTAASNQIDPNTALTTGDDGRPAVLTSIAEGLAHIHLAIQHSIGG